MDWKRIIKEVETRQVREEATVTIFFIDALF